MTSLLRLAPLFFLPALATAAPAPLPRENKRADPNPWSAPVDGLRVCLTAPQKYHRVGDAVGLVLEIQNVSGAPLRLFRPDLPGCVFAPGDVPQAWSISGERAADKREELRRTHRVLAGRIFDPVRLEAGGTLRIEIDVTRGPRSQRKDGVRRLNLRFPELDTPGVYSMRAVFSRDLVGGSGKGIWNGELLESPPVRIVLEK